MRPAGAGAVMASRREPPDSLDFFPTPPWATRALVEHVLAPLGHARIGTVWDPACGEGHMAAPLAEYGSVIASDIFDYGTPGWDLGALWGADFLDPTTADFLVPTGVSWIITNPPFYAADRFALRALDLAEVGVALLCRNSWIEGIGRFERLFCERPPTVFAPFVERVPMVKGRWDPEASSATAYAWFVWLHERPDNLFRTGVIWIPPGCRRRLTRPGDVARFVKAADAPLLDGAP